MGTCKEAHEPIAFSTPVCPACMIIGYYEEKIKDLNERIEVLESEVSNVEAFASLGA